jgi:hypothetical protein
MVGVIAAYIAVGYLVFRLRVWQLAQHDTDLREVMRSLD